MLFVLNSHEHRQLVRNRVFIYRSIFKMSIFVVFDTRNFDTAYTEFATLGVASVLSHSPSKSSYIILVDDTSQQDVIVSVERDIRALHPDASVSISTLTLEEAVETTLNNACFVAQIGTVALNSIFPQHHQCLYNEDHDNIARLCSHKNVNLAFCSASWGLCGVPGLNNAPGCNCTTVESQQEARAVREGRVLEKHGARDEDYNCAQNLLDCAFDGTCTTAPEYAVHIVSCNSLHTALYVSPSHQTAYASACAQVIRKCTAVYKRSLQPCVLITGGLGFIGSHVVEAVMRRMPHTKVVVLDKFTYAANVRNVRNVSGSERFHLECVDLTDYAVVERCLSNHRPSIVMHLAAESHVDKSFGNSLQFTKSNAYGTHVLLEACRSLGIHNTCRFVHMSTDEVYGAGEQYVGGDADDFQGHAPETSLLLPTNPYSASKAAAEMQCHAYQKSFGLPVVIIRCNNVYGPRQYPEKAIPRFTLQMLNGHKCTIHGEGKCIRSFMHASDAASAFVCVTLVANDGDVVNIESKDELSVIDLARRIRSLLGSASTLGDANDPRDSDYLTFVPDRAFNDLRYLIDGTYLTSLGWKPKVPFDQGLSHTVQWYIAHAQEWFLRPDLENAMLTTGHISNAASFALATKAAVRNDTVLLYGSTGWVGPMFARVLQELHGFNVVAGKARMQNTQELYDEINHSGASFVVNAAGITGRPNIDWCETHVSETVNVNLEGAVTLALICNRLGKHLTNFATGCIYTYDDAAGKPEPLPSDQSDDVAIAEDVPPNFIGSVYSRVKAHAERLQSTMLNSTLLLRLRMPLNEDIDHPRNLIRKLLGYRTVISTRNSVSSLPILLPIAAHMLRHHHTGIYNFTNPGHVSPSEILDMYKNLVDPSHTWVEVTAKELEASGTIVAKRSNCYLSASKLQQYCDNNGLGHILSAHEACRANVAAYAQLKQR